ncbi:STAS domain-containing protein [Cellulomonas fengjieae]|uniref:STAS domain-containing protein n=1 Tax=Cellulomonas fengjieae TaxID=2819978 RepID=UPI001AAF750F|nr:STAS domain-containing protein [Cellulomonas fengjieae]MBO3102558.1 STAS domain-containing protein [Cellulomonas fengjieae]
MTFGILQGVFIGVGLSILWLVSRSALPHIPELGRKPGTDAFYDLTQGDDFETYPGILVLRFDGGLFFVNADALGDRLHRIRTESGQQLGAVILSMEGVDFIDTEGADVLKKLAQADAVRGIDLRLARVKPSVERVLARDGFFDVIGRDHLHDTIAQAVEAHLTLHPAPPEREPGARSRS